MKTNKQTKEFTAEDVLDRYFPKGHKQRGNALLLYACAKLEGQKQSEDAFKEMIEELRDFVGNCRFKISNESFSQLDNKIEKLLSKLNSKEEKI